MEEETIAFSPEFCAWLDEPWQSPTHSASTSVFNEDAASLFAEEPIEDVQREEPIQQVQQQNQEEIQRSALLQPTDIVDPQNVQLVVHSLSAPILVLALQQSTVVATPEQLQVQPVCKQDYYVNQAQLVPEVSMAPVPSTSEPQKIDRIPSTQKKGAKGKPRVNMHVCLHCGLKFYKRGEVIRHIKACHTGEKPYECKYNGCKSAFARKDELTRHLRTHAQERPYQCPMCEKRFRRKDHRKNHMRSVHGQFE